MRIKAADFNRLLNTLVGMTLSEAQMAYDNNPGETRQPNADRGLVENGYFYYTYETGVAWGSQGIAHATSVTDLGGNRYKVAFDVYKPGKDLLPSKIKRETYGLPKDQLVRAHRCHRGRVQRVRHRRRDARGGRHARRGALSDELRAESGGGVRSRTLRAPAPCRKCGFPQHVRVLLAIRRTCAYHTDSYCPAPAGFSLCRYAIVGASAAGGTRTATREVEHTDRQAPSLSPVLKTPKELNMAEEKYVPRLKTKYVNEVKQQLQDKFQYKNEHAI